MLALRGATDDALMSWEVSRKSSLSPKIGFVERTTSIRKNEALPFVLET